VLIISVNSKVSPPSFPWLPEKTAAGSNTALAWLSAQSKAWEVCTTPVEGADLNLGFVTLE
jgi:hypothetical protein